MTRRTISDISLAGKTVLMRVDFNVPIRDGRVRNHRRMMAALPSIRHVLDQGAKLILMSHLGRPKGDGFEIGFSMQPVADHLSKILKTPVGLGPKTVVGPDLDRAVGKMQANDIVMLENLRFHPGETMADKAKENPDGKLTVAQQTVLDKFAAAIARVGNAYVNDAFGTSHREHASMYAVARSIQEKGGPAVAGFLVEKEIRYLHDAIAAPKRPLVAILGGAKVADKTKLIANLLPKVDHLLIGGAMAYTLLKAKGVEVGISRVEEEEISEMAQILEMAGEKIILPTDHIAAYSFDPVTKVAGDPVAVPGENIPRALLGLDIGPQTVCAYSAVISSAKTIIWNGPMGVFEVMVYSGGTRSLAGAIARATDGGAVSVIGGGDSAAAIEETALANRVTHVSTGGGASMQFLEGSPMPGIDALDQTS